MKFETTTISDNKGNDKYGIVVSPFETENEAEAFGKFLKKRLREWVRK